MVLGGGYGRGEGGVLRTPKGERLYNDLDFFVFADGASRHEVCTIQNALKSISERWEARLGIAVDFSPVKNLHSLCRVSQTLMYQELLRGWRPVWGKVDLGEWISALNAAELPFSEAARLLLNRGMGLMFAAEKLNAETPDADFVMRNMNKVVLGCGDALILSAGRYQWHGAERVQAFRKYAREHAICSEMISCYEEAYRYKLEPQPLLPENPWENWNRCRWFFLETVRRVSNQSEGASVNDVRKGLIGAAKKERSIRNMLRWLLRAKSMRAWNEVFTPPVVTVLIQLFKEMVQNNGNGQNFYSDRLFALWKAFN